jgi:hypothetical protein
MPLAARRIVVKKPLSFMLPSVIVAILTVALGSLSVDTAPSKRGSSKSGPKTVHAKTSTKKEGSKSKEYGNKATHPKAAGAVKQPLVHRATLSSA